MNVSVIHPSLNVIGGSEQVCLGVLEGLVEKGHHITLGTFEKTDWAKIEKYFGKVTQPDQEVVCSRRFGLFAYGEALNFRMLASEMPGGSDVVLMSCNSPWFYPPLAHKLILYLLPNVEAKRGLRQLYLKPYVLIQRRLLKRVKNKVLLTNSSFSADVIENAYWFRPQVLYPPVNSRAFHPSEKENLVVSTGRFVPEKRFENLVEAFGKVENSVRCIIMGSISEDAPAQSSDYVTRLRKKIKSHGLSDRVKLLVNCPFSPVVEILSKAKIYVHCFENEPFGISIVESMAAGCVPIVHRSGGGYHDIIDHDRYGFSFETGADLCKTINYLMENDNDYEEYSEKAVQRSMLFDKQIFKEKIAELVESGKVAG